MSSQPEIGVQDFVLLDEISFEKFMQNIKKRYVYIFIFVFQLPCCNYIHICINKYDERVIFFFSYQLVFLLQHFLPQLHM